MERLRKPKVPERPLAVVTGASSGIGASFARKLAARGYDLLLVARRKDRLQSIASELAESYGITAEAMPADLARDDDLGRVAEKIRAAPHLALLVNNAGFGSLQYFFEADIRGQDQMHRVHVLATMRLTHAALANLVPRGASLAGKACGVINVSSIAAFGQSPTNVSYCATKAWINSFTEGLALELAALESPVKVQALCPGFTLSEFHDTLGMYRGLIPKSLWMTADFVVDASLRGFDRGRLIVIPGWRYQLFAGMMKVVPAGLKRRTSIAAVRRYRRRKERP
jgi:short-subunit dehydrogenase